MEDLYTPSSFLHFQEKERISQKHTPIGIQIKGDRMNYRQKEQSTSKIFQT